MVKEGYYFGFPLLLLGVVLFGYGTWATIVLGAVAAFLSLFVFYFFRDPERVIPAGPGLIVSPADGRVVVIKDEELDGQPGKRISIFLAIWNVHVNRSPAAGAIRKLEYKPGKFMAAWDERASLDNEQNIFTLTSEHGEIVFKQIAGWVARRVVAWRHTGDELARGERIGLVRFGSRMDVWLPGQPEIAVRVGEYVNGGSSVLARMTEPVGVGVNHIEFPEKSGTMKAEPEHGSESKE